MAEGEERRLEAYLAHRQRLLRLAYRHLGSVGEAEDVVQDAWIRFQASPEPLDAGRFLSRIVTNLCLDRLKSARARRETYVGPWLPEPLIEKAGIVDPEVGETALDISFGVMRALERLSPLERAVLFLHDLFDMPFHEIADTLQRSPAACRKMATRARSALAASGQRFRPSAGDVDRFQQSFMQTLASGDLEPFKRLLADEVEFVSDGGGKVAAALQVVRGADKVARLLYGLAQKQLEHRVASSELARINDLPGLVIALDGQLDQTMSLELDENGLIAGIYVVRNPDKLAHIRFQPEADLGSVASPVSAGSDSTG